jgi:CheY-like chemotaxis protein
VSLVSHLLGSDNYSSVVIGKYKSEEKANSSIAGFNDIILSEPTIKALQKKHYFNVSKKKVEDQYLVSIDPFYDDEVLAVVFYSLKQYFPSAIVIRYKSPKSMLEGDPKTTNSESYHQPKLDKKIVIEQSSSASIFLWILVLLLIGVSVGIFIYYSRHLKVVEAEYETMRSKHDRLEESQNLLLSTVSQRIKESVEAIVAEREKFFQKSMDELSSDVIERTSNRFKSADELLLDTTSDLIVFLKLKSKKLEVDPELFNINNILNEISGQILQKYKNRDIELIFDVNNNVPQLLVGDSSHISKIILNIFEQALKTTKTGEIKLMIDTLSMRESDINIEIKIIDNGEGVEEKWLSKLFVPFSSENITDMDRDNLGLYIAKELVFLMGGEISADSKHGEGTIFTIKLPLKVDESSKNIASSQSRLGIKKVLIIEKNDSASWALEKILRFFGYDTTIKPSNHLGDKMSELVYFDILAIDLSLISSALAEEIETIKAKTNLKVIGLSSLLHDEEVSQNALDIVDRHLIKPLHRERVYEVLANIFSDRYESDEEFRLKVKEARAAALIEEEEPREVDEANSEESADEDFEKSESLNVEEIDKNHLSPKDEENTPTAYEEQVRHIPRVYKGEIHDAEGINKSDFIVFRGAKLLIVEDNTINQKVILRVLNKSGIKIDIASNGEEAIRYLEHQNGEYDFILMDISMPIMDGYTATRIIRSQEQYDHIPIVSLTSLGLDHEIKKMYDSGMNACLIKPLKIGQLYSVFSLFLKKQNLLDTSHIVEEEEYEEEEYEAIDYIEDSAILDTKSGIIYSKGNEVLYIEILKEFLEVYSNNFEKFKEYIDKEDYDSVLSLTRDMSGLSGAIGANNMTHLLSEINQLFIYGAQKQLSLYIDGYKKELEYLTNQIQRYIESRQG